MRPDVVIILTDEERAAPPYEGDDLRALAPRHADRPALVRRARRLASAATTPARWPACPAGRPCSPGSTPTSTASPRPTGSASWPTTPGCAGCATGEVPTLGNWFRAAGYDTHYDGKWHICHADLIDPSTGRPLATNDDDGVVDPAAVQAYLDADPLDPYGFSGWVGPEPHGARAGQQRHPPRPAHRRPRRGLARGPLRPPPGRRPRGAPPVPARRQLREPARHRAVPGVGPARQPHRAVAARPAAGRRRRPPPTRTCATKPAAQVAFRAAYPTGYGPAPAISRIYERGAQRYRDLYYRLHAEVDGPLDRVRRAVTEGGSTDALLVRTSDHGELLGAHGGLHQKWFNLYDEATRVPFTVVRIGDRADHRRARSTRCPPRTSTSSPPCSPPRGHRPGRRRRRAAPLVHRGAPAARPRPAPRRRRTRGGRPRAGRSTSMTRDNMLEGDTGASGLARRLGRTEHAAGAAAHPGAGPRRPTSRHRRAIVDAAVAAATSGSWCGPSTTPPPGPSPACATCAADGAGRRAVPHRSRSPDQWELYDLTDDPIEVRNRARRRERARACSTTSGAARRASAGARCPSATSRGPTWPGEETAR